MSFSFDELLNWARQLEMVVDHRNKPPETMEVLQNEWKAKCLAKNAAYLRSKGINPNFNLDLSFCCSGNQLLTISACAQWIFAISTTMF